MRILAFGKKIYSSLPWLHWKAWRWNGDMHLYPHVGMAWKRIGFGCLGMRVMAFWGWGCVSHYVQNYRQNHNYNHLWAGTLTPPTHILGETGKWASDFLKLTENGQSYFSLCMTVLQLDAPLIASAVLGNPIAVVGCWKEEEMEKKRD